jgi:hypothetical protein
LGLAFQAQLPIFGDVFGLCQTFLLRAAPPLLTPTLAEHCQNRLLGRRKTCTFPPKT